MAQTIDKRLSDIEETIKRQNENRLAELYSIFSDEELDLLAEGVFLPQLVARFTHEAKKRNVVDQESLEKRIELLRRAWNRW